MRAFVSWSKEKIRIKNKVPASERKVLERIKKTILKTVCHTEQLGNLQKIPFWNLSKKRIPYAWFSLLVDNALKPFRFRLKCTMDTTLFVSLFNNNMATWHKCIALCLCKFRQAHYLHPTFVWITGGLTKAPGGSDRSSCNILQQILASSLTLRWDSKIFANVQLHQEMLKSSITGSLNRSFY